mmetsp:Transcript_29803/g.44974  ORF Transcript_29803/g.44974 Transcript_29803/m.44974 type:complete len:212 (+) Transcript_29803:168-803(+)
MGAGKKGKAARRKKRISKHILQSKETVAVDMNTTADANETASPPPTTTSATKTNNKVKDPIEAKSYLSLWKADKDTWKFNKNTQSWLIRHMYLVDYVDKGTFAVMCDYLSGMKGQSCRDRILEDAKRRALRYKEWEKNKKEKEGAEEGSDEKDITTASSSSTLKNEDDDGEKQWSSMSDHDKRKEYKRARRVIDVFKTSSKKEDTKDDDDK